MKLCRRSIFENLGRSRVGLTEADVRLAAKPKRSLLVLAGATGLTPLPTKSGRDVATSGRRDPRGVEPRERA